MNHNTNHNAQINAWQNTSVRTWYTDPGQFIGPREWLPQTATPEEQEKFSLNYVVCDTWGCEVKMCKYATTDFRFAWSSVIADQRRKSCGDWESTKKQLGNREKVFQVWLVNQRLQAKHSRLLGIA